jgi:N-acetylmuramoyl-L-alanine amidase
MIYKGKMKRLGIYLNGKPPYLSMAQVKAKTGCDVICNGFMFNTKTAKPVYNIKLDGAVLAEDAGCAYWGYAWDDSEPPILTQWPTTKANFITTGVALVRDGKAVLDAYYKEDISGSRGRTAIGFDAAGNLILWCSSDAQDPKTMTQLRQIMADAGCVTAINLDGGGSSEAITPDWTVTTPRTIYNYVCIWLDKPTEQEDKRMKVCLDAGHGGTDTSNGSPDGTYKEHEFTLDMAKRVRDLLAPYVDVVMTRDDNETVSLAQRAQIANDANADIFVSIHSNAINGGNWGDPSGLCVYTYAEGGERDKLANELLAQFEADGIKLFGAKLYHAHFTVLAETNMPAVLIESGFHTNRADTELLKNSGYRERLARLMANGILAYLGIKHDTAPVTDPYTTACDALKAAGWGQIIIDMAQKLGGT